MGRHNFTRKLPHGGAIEINVKKHAFWCVLTASGQPMPKGVKRGFAWGSIPEDVSRMMEQEWEDVARRIEGAWAAAKQAVRTAGG